MEKLSSKIDKIQESQNLITAENKKIRDELSMLHKQSDVTDAKLKNIEVDIENIKMAHMPTETTAPITKVADYEKIINEFQERSKREKNVIIVGIDEPMQKNPAERKKYDHDKVFAILQAVYPECPDPLKIIRLGKYNANSNRSIKVILDSAFTAKLILRNKDKAGEKFKIYSDQTPMQQNHLKSLKDELETRKRNGEENLCIKYVKGTPKIIEAQPKNLESLQTQN